MVKKKTSPETILPAVTEKKKSHRSFLVACLFFVLTGMLLGVITSLVLFEKQYTHRVYPGVRIDGVSFGGKTKTDIESYFSQRSLPFEKLAITLTYEDKIATVSPSDLAVSFDEKLAGTQALFVGRSGNFLSDIYQKWIAATKGINLSSIFQLNDAFLEDSLNSLAAQIDIPAQDALFQFENGKVKSFRVSKEGRKLNVQQTKDTLLSYITAVAKQDANPTDNFLLPLPVETVLPKVATENSNHYGIKELLGVGKSKFAGSIAGRIHNIELAASRLNGHLVAPGSVFSFNDALGDVSASTGFQPAYIIKDGRTVLGDGGGVCQVSTTLFRAALASGLPIVERHPHSYRVSYYEQESSVGIDATVFAPSYDLEIKNDTGNYILIQAKTDKANYALAFEIYGTSDGRKVEMTKPVLYAQSAPPPDLYQDDPTLPAGVVKQVDWKAWGGKTSFDYKVTRGDEILFQQTFYSNYQPWQAVFLRGTKT